MSSTERSDNHQENGDVDVYDDEQGQEQEQEAAPPTAPQHVVEAAAIEQLRGLVRYVVDNLVDEPENAQVSVDQRGNMVAFSVRLPEEELGRIIGRGGRIAKSIRTALMIAGSQHHIRVSLDIDASDERQPMLEPEPEPKTES